MTDQDPLHVRFTGLRNWVTQLEGWKLRSVPPCLPIRGNTG